MSNANRICTICGDPEPWHVHDVHDHGRRIEDFFTVGRGQTDFEAAKAWRQRALDAEAFLDVYRAHLNARDLELEKAEAELATLREAAQKLMSLNPTSFGQLNLFKERWCALRAALASTNESDGSEG